MGEDKSKSNSELSDSEAFDIAVRRDDTRSLEELSEDAPKDTAPEETTGESVSFEEKEATKPVESSDVEAESVEDLNTQTAVDMQSKKEESDTLPLPMDRPEPESSEADLRAVVPPTPVAAPVEGVATDTTQHHVNNPGTLVLQWLSYAFWGWFGTAITVLASITFAYFIAGSDATFWGDNLAYPLAAVIVMLVIALAADFFYARREPVQKRGAASVIMLIHAVLYLLTVVAALIGIVFSIISMVITADPTNTMNGTKVFMLTALVTTVVFGAISLRALFAGKKRGVRKTFWLLMSILALGFVIVSIAGPAMKANSTKDDRLIEMALPSLASDIREYTRDNDKLPASLDQVKSTYSNMPNEQVQRMVDKDLVTYKPNTRPMKADPIRTTTSNRSTTSNQTCTTPAECAKQEAAKTTNGVDITQAQLGTKTFYYQLCVTYKEAKSSKYYRDNYGGSDDYVSSTVSTYTHPKGEVCYDVSAQGKNSRYSY